MSVATFDRVLTEDMAGGREPSSLNNERRMQETHEPRGATINLAGLVKHYGASVAVDGVSLDVAPGEFVSLLGPSGSGKTTILMMVAGFVIPNQGTIRLGGDDKIGRAHV